MIVTAKYPFGPAEAFLAAELRALRDRGIRLIIAPISANDTSVMQPVPRDVECWADR